MIHVEYTLFVKCDIFIARLIFHEALYYAQSLKFLTAIYVFTICYFKVDFSGYI